MLFVLNASSGVGLGLGDGEGETLGEGLGLGLGDGEGDGQPAGDSGGDHPGALVHVMQPLNAGAEAEAENREIDDEGRSTRQADAGDRQQRAEQQL